ncbi:MAG: ATP-binding protein [Acidimicrobiia bacterium]|nr:ATP-binding protein [Acidimicrobiia bacterium]
MTGRGGLRRRRHGGVRLAATIVATLVVTAALTVGAVVLVTMIRSELTQTVETTIVTRAQDLAQLARTGSPPSLIPTSRGVSAQIVGGDGRVLASTGEIEGQVPITGIEAAPGEMVIITLTKIDQGDDDQDGEGEADDDGPYLTAITGVDGAMPIRVIVAASLAGVDDATAALVPLLVGGIPLLALVVAATTWLLAGRTLRPVRAMTAEADRITVSDLGRRIPLAAPDDEIRRLGETLNLMLDRLERSVARQRRFVADASHELKSPVASLLTMAEVASQHPERVSGTRFAIDVGIEARRLSLLVDDLLTLARSDEDAFTLEPVAFDLAMLVTEETVHLAASQIEVNLGGAKSLAVVADRRRMAQVVRNLVDNAARHAHSRIWVEVGHVDGEVELVVADDGPGIPEADRVRVFERFVRLDDSRSRTHGGTGLGLAVAQAIVHAHGGIIGIIDDPRYPGAVVRIRLPGAPLR